MAADTQATRPFGFWTATALVVGGMIGSGIFALPASLAPFGWTGVAAWVVTIAGAAVIAWVLAKLAVAMPEATGVLAICGSALGPLPGLLVAWSYWVGIWSANAFIAWTAIGYLSVFFPVLATQWYHCLAAVAAIWLLTLLNLGGAKGSGRFQLATTLLKLLPLIAVVLILAGLTLGIGGHFDTSPHAPFAANGLTSALTLAFFAVVGFESASVATERVRDPARNVVRATLFGLALTGAFYLIVCSGIVFAMPAGTLENAPAPIALFVERFWGHGAALAVAAFAVIATIGCLNGWVLIQGEVPLGLVRAGMLPPWIGRTNDRDVPVGALLVSSGLASLLVMANANSSASGAVEVIVLLTTAATLWLYVGACASAWVMNVARPAAAIGLVFALWVIWGAGWKATEYGLFLMIPAIPLYWLRGASAPVEQPA
jgi:APA family basic amino acid/polyamine antiporter